MMKTPLRLRVVMAGACLAPVLVFAVCSGWLGLGYSTSIPAAAVFVLLSSSFAARQVMGGLISPMARMSDIVKRFIAADYRLDRALPKEGWPEAEKLISTLNRVMLELSAYRAFHLNQLVDERTKAQALIDTINDGILLVDDRGQLIYSNQIALKLLGIPKQEANITLPGSVLQKEFALALGNILASQEKLTSEEVAVPSQDEDSGIVKNFRVTSRLFHLATLKRPGRVLGLRDVTVEMEIESAREIFFHMITHDMRAPLTSIQGYTQLMQAQGPLSPMTEKCLNAVLYASRRLNGMIADILTSMKLERGGVKLQRAPVDGGALCLSVVESHEPLAARKGIKLSFLPLPSKMEFGGDAVLLERVITNLVGNALKFVPRDGAVTLTCREVQGEVVFAVGDNGPGIPKDKQKEIFKKFAQLEEHKYMGFGLGLALCKMAVELHGGRIWVESEEGRGSSFSFSVPIK